jgi:hypothetical protein
VEKKNAIHFLNIPCGEMSSGVEGTLRPVPLSSMGSSKSETPDEPKNHQSKNVLFYVFFIRPTILYRVTNHCFT